jgi:hypothetical protein
VGTAGSGYTHGVQIYPLSGDEGTATEAVATLGLESSMAVQLAGADPSTGRVNSPLAQNEEALLKSTLLGVGFISIGSFSYSVSSDLTF